MQRTEPRTPRGSFAQAGFLVGGLAGTLLAAGACTGPALRVEADGPRYVDGARLVRDELPFRYYGTLLVDTLPPDQPDGRADWSRLPQRTAVELPVPVTRWLFPLDLPVELLGRLFGGPGDQAVQIAPRANPEPVVTGFQPAGLEPLRERALAARVQR
ncbi:MAG: hypothetical protein AB7O97_12870 [Planctomycetota bacterium]